jgi:hypothetical protein
MMPRFSRSRPAFRAAALAVGAMLILSGCNDDTRIAQCPGAAILADAAVRPVLRQGAAATDPSAVLYTVRLTGIETSCTLDRRLGQTDSNVTLTFRATRAPNGQAARYVAPYFLAINQGARIINKRAFNAQIDFGPGVSSVTVQTAVNDTVLKLENGRLPSDYQFLAGMPLSAAEQAYVKTMGPYAP